MSLSAATVKRVLNCLQVPRSVVGWIRFRKRMLDVLALDMGEGGQRIRVLNASSKPTKRLSPNAPRNQANLGVKHFT